MKNTSNTATTFKSIYAHNFLDQHQAARCAMKLRTAFDMYKSAKKTDIILVEHKNPLEFVPVGSAPIYPNNQSFFFIKVGEGSKINFSRETIGFLKEEHITVAWLGAKSLAAWPESLYPFVIARMALDYLHPELQDAEGPGELDGELARHLGLLKELVSFTKVLQEHAPDEKKDSFNTIIEMFEKAEA